MRGLILEFWDFLRHKKTQWMLPIILVAVLFAIMLVLNHTNVAPFIYSFF